jgi:4'-phosphopantetheinyl transferase
MCQLFQVNNEITIALLRVEDYRHRIDMAIIPREQRERVERFQSEHDRTKKLIARSYLFQYCKKHYGLEDFSFVYGEYQRPSFRETAINFSISYSQDMIAIALSTQEVVGLDIECLDASRVSENVASEFMTSDELLIFSERGGDEQVRFFYQVWTAKESFLKAQGSGLTVNPRTITAETNISLYGDSYVMSVTQLP